jgi:hypothetical protein
VTADAKENFKALQFIFNKEEQELLFVAQTGTNDMTVE